MTLPLLKGHGWIIKMQKLKEKHVRSVAVLKELLRYNDRYDYEDAGAAPDFDRSIKFFEAVGKQIEGKY